MSAFASPTREADSSVHAETEEMKKDGRKEEKKERKEERIRLWKRRKEGRKEKKGYERRRK